MTMSLETPFPATAGTSSSAVALQAGIGEPFLDPASVATKTRVMVVDGHPVLGRVLRINLERAGFEVGEARDGEEALIQIAEKQPDVVLLDWNLPLVSGIEVCRRLRRAPDTRRLQIMFVTGRSEEQDRVRGLDSGADDYVVKPYCLPELFARIRALVRRSRPDGFAESLIFEDIVMDLGAHRVTRNGRMIPLGPKDYRLLRFFLQNPRRVFSREHILDQIWGDDIFVEPRTIDVHIRRLRVVLNHPGECDFIRTVRSIGYSLDLPPAQS